MSSVCVLQTRTRVYMQGTFKTANFEKASNLDSCIIGLT